MPADFNLRKRVWLPNLRFVQVSGDSELIRRFVWEAFWYLIKEIDKGTQANFSDCQIMRENYEINYCRHGGFFYLVIASLATLSNLNLSLRSESCQIFLIYYFWQNLSASMFALMLIVLKLCNITYQKENIFQLSRGAEFQTFDFATF